MNRLTVSTKIDGKRISYEYEVSGEWREAFNLDGIEGWYAEAGTGVHDFFIEYDEIVKNVPESIAVIPFLCNVLPIAWLYDAEIHMPELDLDFYNSIRGIKQGYINMYPGLKLGGRVIADRIVANQMKKKWFGTRPLVFFSGGVDANFTLLKKLNEKPMIATIWGSDIFFKHKKEWENVSSQNRKVAKSFDLPYTSIKSSFRLFLNYDVLDEKIKGSGATGYWHGFQHGIGIISHAAPLVWNHGMDTVYISSSYSDKDGDIKCASYPTIDEKVSFAGCRVIHYDFNVTRQDKVSEIVRIAKAKRINVNLRVCWQHASSKNCGKCEKCVRTLLAVMSEGGDPNRFGFSLSDYDYAEIERMLRTGELKPTLYYGEIVNNFLRDKERWMKVPLVRALIEVYNAS